MDTAPSFPPTKEAPLAYQLKLGKLCHLIILNQSQVQEHSHAVDLIFHGESNPIPNKLHHYPRITSPINQKHLDLVWIKSHLVSYHPEED